MMRGQCLAVASADYMSNANVTRISTDNKEQPGSNAEPDETPTAATFQSRASVLGKTMRIKEVHFERWDSLTSKSFADRLSALLLLKTSIG
jgi:hypothetical protein